MNLVVIAVIVLIVLVVLVAIFSGQMGQFTEGVDSTTDDLELLRTAISTSPVQPSEMDCTDFADELVNRNVIQDREGIGYSFRGIDIRLDGSGESGICFSTEDTDNCCFVTD